MIKLKKRAISIDTNRKQTNKSLVTKPIVGILTSQTATGKLRGVIHNFKDMIQAGQKFGAIVFVFTPEDVNWKSNTINGRLYDIKHNNWIRRLFPFPHVVHNRIPNRKLEKKEKYQQCIQGFQAQADVHLFNPHFFYKKELYTILSNSQHVKKHLPETKSLRTKQDFYDMLGKHTSIYLKPTGSKAGSGILKVMTMNNPTEKDTSMLNISMYKNKNIETRQTANHKKMWQEVRQTVKSTPYILQQTIPLATINNCPFDFRTLVQKNKYGKWKISGIGVRVAGQQNSITTHVPKGGRIESPQNVLLELFTPQQAKKIKQHIKKLALAVAEELEKTYGLLGEMTVDIGVDKKGDVWFFEANSKPRKFDEPHIRYKQLKNIINYCQYLTFGHAT